MMEDAFAYLARGSLRDFVRSASAEPLPGPDDARLAEAACRGDVEAAEALIRHHLRMVIDEAARHRDPGVPMTTLVRRGVDALVAATRDFRPDRHGPFPEFAGRRIRASIRETVVSH